MSGPNIKINLSGWKALAIIPAIVLIFGIRIATMDNKKNDANLMEKVEFQLMTEYFPDDVNRMKSLFESGNMDELAKAAKSTTTTKINIKSIKASYSIFDFSTKEKDVVVKVIYSIDDAYGTRKQGTKYYLFKHRPMINGWHYWSERSSLSYYLNFI